MRERANFAAASCAKNYGDRLSFAQLFSQTRNDTLVILVVKYYSYYYYYYY